MTSAMEFDLNKWIAAKRRGDVLIEHVGDFTSSYIDEMLPAMEQKLRDNVEQDNIRKRTFHIFVECAQNLYHHIVPEDIVGKVYGNGKMGAILLTKSKDGCHITTGNFVAKEKSVELKKLIDEINSLDEDQLKQLYRETVSTKGFSEKGGAGLGMIDMARKSRNKLGCQFYPLKEDPTVLFFSFDVCVS